MHKTKDTGFHTLLWTHIEKKEDFLVSKMRLRKINRALRLVVHRKKCSDPSPRKLPSSPASVSSSWPPFYENTLEPALWIHTKRGGGVGALPAGSETSTVADNKYPEKDVINYLG